MKGFAILFAFWMTVPSVFASENYSKSESGQYVKEIPIKEASVDRKSIEFKRTIFEDPQVLERCLFKQDPSETHEDLLVTLKNMSESDLKSVDFQLFSLEKRTIKYNATASDQEKAAETLSPEPSPSQVIQLVAVKIFEQGFRSVDAYLNERYKQVEERLKDPSLREKILEAEKSGLLLKDTALYTNAKRDDPDRYQELRQRIFILASVMKVIEQPEYVHPFLKLQVSQRNPRILKAYREEIQRTQWKRQKNRSYRRLSKWRKGLEFPNKKKIIDEPSPLSQTFVYD